MGSTNRDLLPSERVAELAYQLWEEAGCPFGREEEYWLLAERQMKSRNAARAASESNPNPTAPTAQAA
jgi:hypothetical protein